jgi:hypothetical protein
MICTKKHAGDPTQAPGHPVMSSIIIAIVCTQMLAVPDVASRGFRDDFETDKSLGDVKYRGHVPESSASLYDECH